MKSFNWDRMRNTPETRVIRSQQQTQGREEMVEAFSKQAEADLDKHDRFGELKRDIEKRHPELVNEDSVADRAIAEIIKRHERTLRDDKGLEDGEERVAYITALVREISRRKEQMH